MSAFEDGVLPFLDDRAAGFARTLSEDPSAERDPCSEGAHTIPADALYRPGTYTCMHCQAPVDVPYPISELTFER